MNTMDPNLPLLELVVKSLGRSVSSSCLWVAASRDF
jgi:hypothetical protein